MKLLPGFYPCSSHVHLSSLTQKVLKILPKSFKNSILINQKWSNMDSILVWKSVSRDLGNCKIVKRSQNVISYQKNRNQFAKPRFWLKTANYPSTNKGLSLVIIPSLCIIQKLFEWITKRGWRWFFRFLFKYKPVVFEWNAKFWANKEVWDGNTGLTIFEKLLNRLEVSYDKTKTTLFLLKQL